MNIYLLLFILFFEIGLFTIGGGYAMIPLMIDKLGQYNLASKEELLNFIAISESTPGTFAINVATFVGYKNGGIVGGIISTLGLIVPSIIIITIIAKLASNFSDNKYVKNALKGIRPVVIGLIGAVLIDLTYTNLYLNNSINYNFILITILLLLFKNKYKKIHPIFLVGIGAILGIMLY